MGRFVEKVVIVTGASSGIGAAIAFAFAKEGAKLTITGLNKERLDETASRCRAEGAKILDLISDISKFENLEPLVNKTVETFGRIDVLVNNAATNVMSIIGEVTLEAYEIIFNTNLRAPVFLSKFSLPYLKKTRGCVVNISSVSAIRPMTKRVPYSMTKAALDHFTRGFAAECSAFGVRVNSINPAFTRTRIMEKMGITKEITDQMMRGQELGWIEPEEIADNVLHLSTPSHITGSSLVIDGAYLLPTS